MLKITETAAMVVAISKFKMLNYHRKKYNLKEVHLIRWGFG